MSVQAMAVCVCVREKRDTVDIQREREAGRNHRTTDRAHDSVGSCIIKSFMTFLSVTFDTHAHDCSVRDDLEGKSYF